MSKAYVVREYGPGYCRNGHERAVHGQHKDGSCKRCKAESKARNYRKNVKPARDRDRAARELLTATDPMADVLADVAAMRERVAERRKALQRNNY